MKKIVVIGSLNMDFVVNVKDAPGRGETILAKNMELIPGGKGANQAFAAAKLGGIVTMLGAIGTDGYGQILSSNLEAAGVDVSQLKVVEGSNTGVALVLVDEQGDNRIVVIQGTNGLVDIPYIESKLEVIRQSDIVIMQLEIPLETVVYVAGVAKELGKTVILDPAPARGDLPDELFRNVDIIKPNEHEIIALLDEKEGLSLEEAVCRLKAKGAKEVLVTMGEAGSCYYGEGDSVIRAEAFSVESVDSTGAGDSYTAALAVELAKDVPMEQAMTFASKIGAMVTTKKGAQSSIPTREEADAWN